MCAAAADFKQDYQRRAHAPSKNAADWPETGWTTAPIFNPVVRCPLPIDPNLYEGCDDHPLPQDRLSTSGKDRFARFRPKLTSSAPTGRPSLGKNLSMHPRYYQPQPEVLHLLEEQHHQRESTPTSPSTEPHSEEPVRSRPLLQQQLPTGSEAAERSPHPSVRSSAGLARIKSPTWLRGSRPGIPAICLSGSTHFGPKSAPPGSTFHAPQYAPYNAHEATQLSSPVPNSDKSEEEAEADAGRTPMHDNREDYVRAPQIGMLGPARVMGGGVAVTPPTDLTKTSKRSLRPVLPAVPTSSSSTSGASAVNFKATEAYIYKSLPLPKPKSSASVRTTGIQREQRLRFCGISPPGNSKLTCATHAKHEFELYRHRIAHLLHETLLCERAALTGEPLNYAELTFGGFQASFSRCPRCWKRFTRLDALLRHQTQKKKACYELFAGPGQLSPAHRLARVQHELERCEARLRWIETPIPLPRTGIALVEYSMGIPDTAKDVHAVVRGICSVEETYAGRYRITAAKRGKEYQVQLLDHGEGGGIPLGTNQGEVVLNSVEQSN